MINPITRNKYFMIASSQYLKTCNGCVYSAKLLGNGGCCRRVYSESDRIDQTVDE